MTIKSILQLIKVENGLLDGEVLFHELISKTEEEKRAIQKKREQKRKLKEKRKKIQEENKRNKEEQKQAHKEKSLKGILKKKESDILLQKLAKESVEKSEVEEDDDAQYYREEVGEEPDKGIVIILNVNISYKTIFKIFQFSMIKQFFSFQICSKGILARRDRIST